MKVIKEELNEGKFLNTAKAVGKTAKKLADKAVDYWENGSEEDKALDAQLKREREEAEADRRKSEVFFASGNDMCIEKIKSFVRSYNGYQVWEDIGKEFGDAAIDFALQMEKYGLIHILPSMEARSYLNPNR